MLGNETLLKNACVRCVFNIVLLDLTAFANVMISRRFYMLKWAMIDGTSTPVEACRNTENIVMKTENSKSRRTTLIHRVVNVQIYIRV